MSKYEDMSDFEINTTVAEILGKVIQSPIKKGQQVVRVLSQKLDGEVKDFNPCNNPSDAWPIIFENEIGITHGSVMCSAVALVNNEAIQVACEPSEILRAAMIVFLMIKDAE